MLVLANDVFVPEEEEISYLNHDYRPQNAIVLVDVVLVVEVVPVLEKSNITLFEFEAYLLVVVSNVVLLVLVVVSNVVLLVLVVVSNVVLLVLVVVSNVVLLVLVVVSNVVLLVLVVVDVDVDA